MYLDVPRARHILVLDDDEAYCKMLTSRLFSAGFDVTVAKNGRQGLEKLKIKKTFSVILCDLNMPMMSGEEFVRELKHSQGYEAPLLVITGSADLKQIKAAIDAGCDKVLIKPISTDELIKEIEDAINLY